mgnify:CR=1 FL=1
MGIRKYKPTTPGRRGSSVADFVEVTNTGPTAVDVSALTFVDGDPTHAALPFAAAGSTWSRRAATMANSAATKNALSAISATVTTRALQAVDVGCRTV